MIQLLQVGSREGLMPLLATISALVLAFLCGLIVGIALEVRSTLKQDKLAGFSLDTSELLLAEITDMHTKVKTALAAAESLRAEGDRFLEETKAMRVEQSKNLESSLSFLAQVQETNANS
jgi:hypothetical protein